MATKIDRRMYKGMNLLRVGLESIRIELGSLDDYIDETATTLERKQRELEKRYKEARDKNPEDDSELDMYFSDEFHRYHELFPTFTFNSILVSQFSFFESRLKFLCELHHRKKFSNVKLNDLNGSDIEKCRRYLTLVAEINFDSFQDKWKKITDIQKLRNAIIHNSSKIANEKENNSILNFIRADKRIEYTEQHGDFYINDVSFLKDFSKLLLDFFILLVDKLAATKVVARNTSMPYDNTAWGQEKTEKLLKEIIHGLALLKDNETRTDEFKDSDLKANIRGLLGSMTFDLTKLYAFFCDGDWEVKDRELIMEQGEEGLEHLKKVYRRP
jgi:hypothetical protein